MRTKDAQLRKCSSSGPLRADFCALNFCLIHCILSQPHQRPAMIKSFLSLFMLSCIAFAGFAQKLPNKPSIRHQIGYETGFDMPILFPLYPAKNVAIGPTYHHGLQYAFRPKKWLQFEVGIQYTIAFDKIQGFDGTLIPIYSSSRLLSIPIKTRVNWLQKNRFEASSFLMAQPVIINRFSSDLSLAIGSGVAYRYHELLFRADVLAFPIWSKLRAANFVQPGMRFGVNYCF